MVQQSENVRDTTDSASTTAGQSPGGMLRLSSQSGSAADIIAKLVLLGVALAIAIFATVPLIKAESEHPGGTTWYDRDWKGDYRPTPWWDWDDIIDLDYTSRNCVGT